jgi:Ca2+-binding EF-hand superfamily protein
MAGWLLPSAGGLLADDLRPERPAVPDAVEPDDACEFLFLGPERPVFLRVHLRVDERSFRAGWNDFCQRMFRAIDRNGDGLLAEAEWSGLPDLELLVDGNLNGMPVGIDVARQEIDLAPADGLITLEELTRALEARGAQPLLLQTLIPGAPLGPGGAVARRDSGIGTALFSRLDTDGDGRLSRDELSAGPRSLAPIDFDDDGAFSRLELQPARPGNRSVQPATARPDELPAELIDLSAENSAESTARRLLDRYDHGSPSANGSTPDSAGDETLDRREAPFPADLFDLLDANHDDRLDFDELQRIAQCRQPEIELLVRIGERRPNQPLAEIVEQTADLNAVVRTVANGPITILVAGAQLEIDSHTADTGSRIREFFQQQFRQVDADNNRYLDAKESRRSPSFGLTFDAMDEDGDGKLFESEMLAYIGRREAATSSRYTLGVADEGRNLFEMLDSNRDGRLGPRELLYAPAKMAAWDGDRDGRLSEAEIPVSYRLVFGRALPNIHGLPNLLATRAGGAIAAGSARERGPAWFHKMDRNRDGDLSRREFLGSRAAFEALDTDHDGLIDAAEAGTQP